MSVWNMLNMGDIKGGGVDDAARGLVFIFSGHNTRTLCNCLSMKRNNILQYIYIVTYSVICTLVLTYSIGVVTG